MESGHRKNVIFWESTGSEYFEGCFFLVRESRCDAPRGSDAAEPTGGISRSDADEKVLLKEANRIVREAEARFRADARRVRHRTIGGREAALLLLGVFVGVLLGTLLFFIFK